ncbi:MAG: NADH-quinone oxidoreductase subunit C [SAR202 cluster bacterium]|nr:NADH-quinone oxidoreductase subunit C [SAR202 cluster bacterium]
MAVQQLTGEELSERVGAAVSGSVVASVDGVLFVEPAKIADVAGFMKSDSRLDFNFLNSISAVDYINHFEVVYHLTSMNKHHTAIVKTRLDGRDELTLPSVYHLWRGADFQEREIWDLMGISFAGHPNLKRIMLWEGFDGHPLRKDYL